MELELAPEPAVLASEPQAESFGGSAADQKDESTVEVMEASNVIQASMIAQPESMAELVDISREPPDEEKTGMRSKRRRGQAVPGATSERQLTLVKLERVLSSISKLRK